MYVNPRTKRNFIYFMVAIALTTAFNIVFYGEDVSCGAHAVISSILVAAWITTVKTRVNGQSGKFLQGIGYVAIFWFALQNIKFNYFSNDTIVGRYAWYGYYLAIVLMPLLSFYVSMEIGHTVRNPLSGKWKLLWIPAVLLIFFVFTNDYHQCVFRFPDGIPNTVLYKRVWGYHLVAIWCVGLLVAVFFVTLKKCAVQELKSYLIIPLIPIIICGACMILLSLDIMPRINGWKIELSQAFSYMIIIFWECCVFVGYLPSNRGYTSFLRASKLPIWIVDKNGMIKYRGRNAFGRNIPKESDEKWIVHKDRIPGGSVYWLEDISAISKISQKLAEAKDRLSEEGEVIQTEQKIIEDQVRYQTRNSLFDKIMEPLRPFIFALQERLASAQSPTELAKVCVLGAYVKRRSNFAILADASGRLDAGELNLALRETCEYLELMGVTCGLFGALEGMVDAEELIHVYDAIGDELFRKLDSISALFIELKCEPEALVVRVMCTAGSDDDSFERRIERGGVS